MTRAFKVGDKVKIIKIMRYHLRGVIYLDHVGTIVGETANEYKTLGYDWDVAFKNEFAPICFAKEELAPVKHIDLRKRIL